MAEIFKKCPYCAKTLVNPQAVICIHCGRNVVSGAVIPSKVSAKKLPDSSPPPKAKKPLSTEKSPRRYGKKAFYAIKLTAAIVLVIFAGMIFFNAYGKYKKQQLENATGASETTTSARSALANKPTLIAGNAVETAETPDEAVAETMLKTVIACYVGVNPVFPPQAGSREIKVSLNGNVRFQPDQEQPLRLKIYRSAKSDGKYSLIFNQELKDFNRPVINVINNSPDDGMKKSLERMKKTQEKFPRPELQKQIEMMQQRIAQHEAMLARAKQNGTKITRTVTTDSSHLGGASLWFNLSDASPLDCGSNNVFYKVKFCSESGTPVLESKVMKVTLAPRVVMAADRKSWTWTPFFPGRDKLDGALEVSGKKGSIPVSNIQVKGQLDEPLAEQKSTRLPVFFHSSKYFGGSWNYDRSRNSYSFASADAVEIIPVFNKSGYLFEARGNIVLKSLKIDGRKVGIQADKKDTSIYVNGVASKIPLQIIPLNYPGTPVAELEFEYEKKNHKLSLKLLPAPTGLRAELLDDGSVKLTWDSLAELIDRKQFPAMPDIKLFKGEKAIHACDINQTEFIDKQTEPGDIYEYSMALDNVNAKVQKWTKEKGLTDTKILLKDLTNPYPEKSEATVYICPEKPVTRPIRVSFWEPALCYERTGAPGMQLFAAALRKLEQEKDIEALDRASRNNVIEEKILTMSYEKSIMIKTLPADFTVLVRDYTRQEGNGVELWLIRNKRFDYKQVKKHGYARLRHVTHSLQTYADEDFVAWRIGSINEDELKIPEKANALGDKLVAEIKRRCVLKVAENTRSNIAPVKFVFNPLESVKQKNIVVDEQAVGESLMVGLSNLMPGCEIMTRDSWKVIFGEQELMRELGEKFDNDISGTVLILGKVWLENNKKQYAFILTDIRSGICVGTLQCSGNIESVTAKLADVCRKIRPVIDNYEVCEQTKAELQREHWKIYDCFMKRFGLHKTEKLYKSLEQHEEMNQTKFAEKQWKMGNRENAVKILEKMFKADKSAWWQLKIYHCEMGNYTRALQLIETAMQQKNANNYLIPEYYRLQALIAANAGPPPNRAAKESDEKAHNPDSLSIYYEYEKPSGNLNGAAMGRLTTGNDASNQTPSAHKVKSVTIIDFRNGHLPEQYFSKLSAWGIEWNPGGQCRSMIKRQAANGMKCEEWLRGSKVKSDGVLISAFQDIGMRKSWSSEALWESAPLFGSDNTMAFSGAVNLFGTDGAFEILSKEQGHEVEHENFSPVRAYLEIAKNPEIKLVPVVEKFSSGSSGYGSQVYGREERGKNKDASECNSGRKFLEYNLKQLVKLRKKNFGSIKLSDMLCIYTLAKLGNYKAQEMLMEINAIRLPSSWEQLHKFIPDGYEPYDLLTFRAYRGDRDSIRLVLKEFGNGRCCLGSQYKGSSSDGMKDVYYLMAKTGRKEIVTAMLSSGGECRYEESIAAIRWGDLKMLKSLLLENPELFQLDLYFYLIEGLNDPEFSVKLFNNRMIYQNIVQEAMIKAGLFIGKPLPELYREQTLNYYKQGK